jgi:hypothetical protein
MIPRRVAPSASLEIVNLTVLPGAALIVVPSSVSEIVVALANEVIHRTNIIINNFFITSSF